MMSVHSIRTPAFGMPSLSNGVVRRSVISFGRHSDNRDNMQRGIQLLFAAIAGLAGLSLPSYANDFYAGKTITLVVGSEAGGGFDIVARVLARHLSRVVPGHPNAIVQNMPGAGGVRAATYLYKVAPKDGTTLATIQPGTIVNALLSPSGRDNFDPSKYLYIGSTDSSARLCATTIKSGFKTFDDTIARKTIIGGSQAGSSTVDHAFLIKNTTNAKLEIVQGYKNTSEIVLAMERGEVDGMCGWTLSSLQGQQADYKSKFNLILQTALVSNPALESSGVPHIDKYYRDEESRRVGQFVLAQQVFGRPYMLPPGTPDEPVAILRKAFDDLMRDEQFLADAERTRLDLSPVDGVTVQGAVSKFFATPLALIEKAKDAVRK